ncbi:MAG: EAL domain-containing protein [Rhodocyclales bacterium]|nr:EAL domain-containing protein [Rhodocyclales bacterium]
MKTASAIHPHVILDCINARRFGVEYQPFVSIASGEVLCYEALARFVDAGGRALPPDLVFGALHDNPLLLLHTELEMKRLQLAEAPAHGQLFVNLDPDSFIAGETEDGSNLFLPLLATQRSRLVVEIIENLHLQDVTISARMIAALDAARIRMAIDDLSSSRGLVSYAALMSAAYVKFDRSWLSGTMSERQRTLLTWALAQAADLGLATVLEGVETPEHLALARQMGFNLVQGFLYADRFLRRGCQAGRRHHPGAAALPAAA